MRGAEFRHIKRNLFKGCPWQKKRAKRTMEYSGCRSDVKRWNRCRRKKGGGGDMVEKVVSWGGGGDALKRKPNKKKSPHVYTGQREIRSSSEAD